MMVMSEKSVLRLCAFDKITEFGSAQVHIFSRNETSRRFMCEQNIEVGAVDERIKMRLSIMLELALRQNGGFTRIMISWTRSMTTLP